MGVAEIFIENTKKYIEPEAIKTIYDIGAGDCAESIVLANHFSKAHVYAFEANPACIYDCAKKIVNDPRITLIPICVNDYTGLVKFHPINQEKTQTTWPDGNPKASSIFVSNGTYELEKYVQDEIEIPCMTLSSMQTLFGLPSPELVWMDLQGAELNALRGLDLNNVHILHTEIWGQEIYTGQSLFDEIKIYMEQEGFECKHEPLPENWVWADADFVRKDILQQVNVEGNNGNSGQS